MSSTPSITLSTASVPSSGYGHYAPPVAFGTVYQVSAHIDDETRNALTHWFRRSGKPRRTRAQQADKFSVGSSFPHLGRIMHDYYGCQNDAMLEDTRTDVIIRGNEGDFAAFLNENPLDPSLLKKMARCLWPFRPKPRPLYVVTDRYCGGPVLWRTTQGRLVLDDTRLRPGESMMDAEAIPVIDEDPKVRESLIERFIALHQARNDVVNVY
ncbi:MAG: hypothetical protein KC475_07420 [Cyanobacteria bacterium HKST-UBA03]|nr:hypothetical protein [Cyanobacteria bacterium HKST-UBA03]